MSAAPVPADMIDALNGSILGGVLQPLRAPAAARGGAFSARSSDGDRFGAAFVLGEFGERLLASVASAYDRTGRPVLPENSAPRRERQRTLIEARRRLREGDAAGARTAALPLLERDARDATVAYLIGQSYLKDRGYRAAERYLARAAATSDGSERIEEELRAARILQQGDDAVLSDVRRLLSQRATSQQGVRLATYLVERSPRNAEARIVLADFYESLGKLNLAGAEFADAIDSVDGPGLRSLVDRLERFAAEHDADAGSHDLLAQAYARSGRNEDAEAQFQLVERLSDGTIDVDADRADVYSDLGRRFERAGRVADARRAYLRASALRRDDVRRRDLSRFELGVAGAELARGNLRFALEALDRARLHVPVQDGDDLKEQLIAAYKRLAGKYEQAGDLARVVSARRGAYLLDTQDDGLKRGLADAHDALGLSQIDATDYANAIKSFEAALTLYPDDAGYQAHLNSAQNPS